jgi:hypothetical protein
MKTSTKLIIILLISVPASLWAYSYLLKKRVDAHAIVLELKPEHLDENFTPKDLPPFRHVVIDGTLVMGEGKNVTRFIDWQPRVTIGDYSQSSKNIIRILKGFEPVVNTTVSNDTLYITFSKKVPTKMKNYNEDNYYSEIAKVSITDLQSFTGSFGQFYLNVSPDIRSLKLDMAGTGSLELNGMLLKKAYITLHDSATATLNKVKYYDLYLNLLNKSRVTLDDNSAEHFHTLQVDTSAVMIINGKASKIKALLDK